MNESEKIDTLLVKVMLKEASENEQQEVVRWLAEDQQNHTYYTHFQKIWEESRKLATHNPVDEDAAWKRFKSRTERQPTVMAHPAGRNALWLRIAAVFVAVLGIAGVFLLNKETAAPELLTRNSHDKPLTDSLPDGSVIHLNRHSALTYAKDFADPEQRQVTLEGEAFFEVARDTSRPFIIQVNNVTITVLGTSFNVKSTNKTTEVIVETGLVEVKNTAQKIKVAPDEMAVIPAGTAPLTKQKKPNDLYSYYFTQRLVCDDTPLADLVNLLEEAYGTPIVITEHTLKQKTINTVIEMHKTLQENLDVINQTMGTTTYTKNDTIFLK